MRISMQNPPSRGRITRAIQAAAIVSLSALTIMAAAPSSRAQVNVLTRHNDNKRSGENLNEATLTTSNVTQSQFGKLFTITVDGFTHAQPLYASAIAIPGQGTHNVLYVATEHDSVYAFDADTGAQLWTVNKGPSIPANQIQAGNQSCNSGVYPDMGPEVGIASTPVIDLTTGTLYCFSRTKSGTLWTQTLHALDITTGAEKFGGPVNIPATVTTQAGSKNFNLGVENQRAALTLANGNITICWASHGDCGGGTGYNGYVMNYNAATLAFESAFDITPSNSNGMAGIWMTGNGPAVDDTGNLYLTTGNGQFNGNTSGTDWGMSVLKFGATSALTMADWFTPFNYTNLNNGDYDLASSGCLLIPGTTQLVATAKNGTLYLINSTSMSHFHSAGDQILSELTFSSNQQMNSPVCYNSPVNGQLVYVSACGDTIKAYKVLNNAYVTTPSSQSPEAAPAGYSSGAALSVSANGTTSGTGILWAAMSISGDPNLLTVPGVLRAYDANNIGTELWNSEQNSARDSLGNYAKWTPPTIANGKVYAPTFSGQIVVYGLLGTSVPPAPTNLVASPGNTQVSLTWTASGGATSYNVKRATVSGGPYTTVGSPATTAFTNTGLTNGTTYYFVVSAVNSHGESANSSQVSAIPTNSAPPAPTGLIATAGNTQVALSWNSSAGATSYNVKRSTVTGGPYANVATGVAATSYTNTGLTNGTTYYFVVSAVNAIGESANSAQASATPASVTIAINAGGPAVSPFVADVDFSGGTAATNWTGAIDTSAVTNPAPQAVYQSERYGSPALSYTVPGLTVGAAYTVRLHFCENFFTTSGQRRFSVSINGTPVLTNFDIWLSAGAAHKANIQQFSATANAGGQIAIAFTNVTNNALVNGIEIVPNGVTPPPAPTGLTATPGNAQVALAWNASSGATSYNVYRGTVNGGPYNLVTSGVVPTNYTNTGLTNGTTYYFVVSATNSGGTSGNSNQASATPSGGGGIPPVPTGLTATAGNTQIALSWNASAGATSYNVKRSTVSGSGYVTVSSPATTSYTNTGLTNGVTYYYVVSAVNASGESANSAQVSAFPYAAAIAPATTAPVIDGTIDAIWSTATAYNINKLNIGTAVPASDSSGTFKALWDSTNLYVLFQVTDDVKVNDSTNPWDDDCVEVFVDGNYSHGSSYDGVDDIHWAFGWGDTVVNESGGPAGRTTGITFAKTDPTSTTYVIEIKIPWTTIGDTASTGKIIGFDAQIDDDDDGGARDNALAFSDTNNTGWSTPSVFAAARLN